MTTNHDSEEVLTWTVEQAGRRLGISRGSAYQAVRRGELPTIRIGRRLLVPLAALNAMLAGEPVTSHTTGGR
jgi:excisionase family DNA binding protein